MRQGRPYRQRLLPTEPLITGQRVLDTLFPLARGGAAAIPGGFGTGKTVTQHQLSKWCEADLIVYVGCGERGNEMTGILTELPALQDPRTGHPLLERTILIAITQTLDLAWQILKELPRGDLTRVTAAEIEQFGGWDQGQ